MSVAIAGCSRAKGRRNEDAYLIETGHSLFGVFDGLGATAQAAEAAQLAADAIQAAYREHEIDDDCTREAAFLALAVRGAGALIASSLADGLTTASVVKICDTGDGVAVALICNVGDSRVYRFTPAGELGQCTLDDSMFGTDWDVQRQLGEVVVPKGLLERAYLQWRHVMDRALGERPTNPHSWEVPADDGDLLVAVTDGVTDNLTFSELRQLLGGAHDGPDHIAQALVAAAAERSRQTTHPRAKIDDITAVVARVRRGTPALAPDVSQQERTGGPP